MADWARGQGCGRLYWLTHESNATARALYDKVAVNRGHPLDIALGDGRAGAAAPPPPPFARSPSPALYGADEERGSELGDVVEAVRTEAGDEVSEALAHLGAGLRGAGHVEGLAVVAKLKAASQASALTSPKIRSAATKSRCGRKPIEVPQAAAWCSSLRA